MTNIKSVDNLRVKILMINKKYKIKNLLSFYFFCYSLNVPINIIKKDSLDLIAVRSIQDTNINI